MGNSQGKGAPPVASPNVLEGHEAESDGQQGSPPSDVSRQGSNPSKNTPASCTATYGCSGYHTPPASPLSGFFVSPPLSPQLTTDLRRVSSELDEPEQCFALSPHESIQVGSTAAFRTAKKVSFQDNIERVGASLDLVRDISHKSSPADLPARPPRAVHRMKSFQSAPSLLEIGDAAGNRPERENLKELQEATAASACPGRWWEDSWPGA
jgi:hypothetical protein